MELVDRTDLLAKINALWTIKPNTGTDLLVKSAVQAVINKQWTLTEGTSDIGWIPIEMMVVLKEEVQGVLSRAWVVYPPGDTGMPLPDDLELVLKYEIIEGIEGIVRANE
ncbi:hypothetical protein GE09DRAFT_1232432 [Coniochaeta sp. 2T2.1]|nr:hypothetical protein GE09DRAFT_1232432 [Coniochaeta sp. 2T2.1]